MAMDTKDVKLLRAGIAKLIARPVEDTGLRGPQVDAFRALVDAKKTDEEIGHGYFKLPTGFGKTVMFSHMGRAYFDMADTTGTKRQQIIIIVPRLGLIDQTQEKLQKFAGIVPWPTKDKIAQEKLKATGKLTSAEYSGREKNINSDVVITTYNSLSKLFGPGLVDFANVGFIFADEVHHSLGDTIFKKLSYCNDFVPVIGFTATPEYTPDRTVKQLLGKEIYAMTIKEAVSGGVLCPVKNVLYRSSIVCDLSDVPAKSTGEYDWSKIKISPKTLATEIAKIYAYGVDENTGIEFKNLRAIVNCPNTDIAKLQADMINKIMGREVAMAIHTNGISNEKFKDLQNDFVSGKYSVACQVNTLTEGFDDVTVSMCINYPTRSRVRAEQAAGRAIRIDEDNENKIAFVVDTIFRATPDEAAEDILLTASNSKQVLFKDIAGDMVLYPKDFQIQRTGNHGPRNNGNVRFVDFDLITDTATLIELDKQEKERVAAEDMTGYLKVDTLAEMLGKYIVTIRNKLKELKNSSNTDPRLERLKGLIGKEAFGRGIAYSLEEKEGLPLFLEVTGWKLANNMSGYLKLDTLAEMLGMHTNTVRKKLKELKNSRNTNPRLEKLKGLIGKEAFGGRISYSLEEKEGLPLLLDVTGWTLAKPKKDLTGYLKSDELSEMLGKHPTTVRDKLKELKNSPNTDSRLEKLKGLIAEESYGRGTAYHLEEKEGLPLLLDITGWTLVKDKKNLTGYLKSDELSEMLGKHTTTVRDKLKELKNSRDTNPRLEKLKGLIAEEAFGTGIAYSLEEKDGLPLLLDVTGWTLAKDKKDLTGYLKLDTLAEMLGKHTNTVRDKLKELKNSPNTDSRLEKLKGLIAEESYGRGTAYHLEETKGLPLFMEITGWKLDGAKSDKVSQMQRGVAAVTAATDLIDTDRAIKSTTATPVHKK